MPSTILYLLKCSISLSIVWLFYQLLLRRLTFYSVNRWYLMGYVVLSFLLPLIHIALPAEKEMPGNMQVIRYIPNLTGLSAGRNPRRLDVMFTRWDILLIVVALGSMLLLAQLLIRYLSLRRMRQRAVLLQDSRMAIYHVDEPIIPFSFGKAIYLNPRLHTEKEYEEIILHEYIHVRQQHSIDIFLGEALCIVSWFNPFSWLIRHSIRQNLEFIADRQVLASGLDKKAYQYHLLKVVGVPSYRLANNFNFSSLKKRIVMMNKSRSARLHLVKFLFIVPLLGVLLVAFRDRVDIGLPSVGFHSSNEQTPNMTAPYLILEKEAPSVRITDADTLGHPKKDTLKSTSRLVKTLDDSTQPIYILDEVETSGDIIKTLKPSDIAWIEVRKSDPRVVAFGAAAKGGAVMIYTKVYAPNRKNVITLKDGTKVRYETSEPAPKPDRDSLPAPLKDTAKKEDLSLAEASAIKAAKDVADTSPYHALREELFIVDGKPWNYEDVQKLDPNKIESMTVLKNKSAEAIYGPRARNGVVLFVLKTSVTKGQTLTVTTDNETIKAKADTIRLEPGAANH
jgi:TonB-dependent SusC/RagA subfamily outer membrane receptor